MKQHEWLADTLLVVPGRQTTALEIATHVPSLRVRTLVPWVRRQLVLARPAGSRHPQSGDDFIVSHMHEPGCSDKQRAERCRGKSIQKMRRFGSL